MTSPEIDNGSNVLVRFKRIEHTGDKAVKISIPFGHEFMVWIPSVKVFATLFMGTKSARREAGNVKSRLHLAATMGNQFCKNKDFEWYAPECTACNTPFEMPEKAALLEAVEKFRNPPKSDVEGVKEEESESRAR